MHSDEIQGSMLAGQRPLYTAVDRVWTQQNALMDRKSAADFYDEQLG